MPKNDLYYELKHLSIVKNLISTLTINKIDNFGTKRSMT